MTVAQGTKCGDDQGWFHGAWALNMAPQDEIAQLLGGKLFQGTPEGDLYGMISMGIQWCYSLLECDFLELYGGLMGGNGECLGGSWDLVAT